VRQGEAHRHEQWSAQYRKPLAAVAGLNTVICVGLAVAGFQSESLSLIIDSAHNLSDEVALILLYLAVGAPSVLRPD
jgi:Co/Zn/Cd efflux system component